MAVRINVELAALRAQPCDLQAIGCGLGAQLQPAQARVVDGELCDVEFDRGQRAWIGAVVCCGRWCRGVVVRQADGQAGEFDTDGVAIALPRHREAPGERGGLQRSLPRRGVALRREPHIVELQGIVAQLVNAEIDGNGQVAGAATGIG